ncbi:hypothetical protein C0992_012623 [Termitomyces sp. T32_za158]|nr:hypothetical protein C0992_012623 [Termitomyces sp. T32_za158]
MKCHNQFCPTHRFPTDHHCTSVSAPASSSGASKVITSANAKSVNSKVTVAGVATLDVFKKATASAKVAIRGPEPGPSAPVTSKPSAPSSHMNPFSKTDSTLPSFVNFEQSLTTFLTNDTEPLRDNKPVSTTTPLIDYNAFVPPPIFARAKAERESRLRAMQARAKKGLLSEEEKATLAAEEQATKRKDDCIVM